MASPPVGQVVVLFKTHARPGADEKEIEKLDRKMYRIVSRMPGFISLKAHTDEDGEEVGVVRFKSEEALAEWRNHPEHRAAQRRGRREFYDYVWVQVCKVIRDYDFGAKGLRRMDRTMRRSGTWTMGTEGQGKKRPRGRTQR